MKKYSFPYYKLKDGENLKTVCQKFGIDATKLLLENNLSPKQITAGTLIKIPKK